MPRQGLGHSSIDIYNMVTPGTDDPVWKHPVSGQLMVGYQETRTNNVLHSQDATEAEAWTKTNTAIDSTLYEAPDNSTTANAIKSNNTGERSYTLKQQNLSVTAGKTYTLSVHLKKENLGFAQVRFNDGSVQYRSHFNLTTGAMTNAAQIISNSIDAMDDGWFRCSITFQAQNTVSDGDAIVIAQSAAGDATPNVAVLGVVLLYVWGFQLEENSEMSTYIPTTSSARTLTTPLNDTSEIWDFDGADLMPEEKPSDDGAWEVPDNLVLNHDYADLGSELVTNGGFDTDSNWTFAGTNGAVSNGVGVFADTTNSYIIQSSVVPASVKQYKLQYEVIESNGGAGFGLSGGSSAFGSVSLTNSVGVHTKFITSNGSQTNLQFNNGGNFIGKIDNISVKQVDPNDRWTLGTGVTIEDGKLKINGGALQGAQQSNVITSGIPCSVTFTVSNYVSGTVNLRHPLSQEVSANGTYTFTGDANSTKVLIRGSAVSNEFTIDNVTVKEYAIQPQDV